MTESFIIGVGGAFWLGVLTSISPCPLATNVAAVSYVGKRFDSPRFTLLAGLLYTTGRALAYLTVALIALKSLFSTPAVSQFLQERTNQILGPVLIAAGVLLLNVIPIPFLGSGGGGADKLRSRADQLGVWGAGLLGVAFAMTFCPVSAALFFGSLIPLSIKSGSAFVMPLAYGVGTAAPVLFFSFALAFSANRLSRFFNAVSKAEKIMRCATAAVFIAVGIYYSLTFIFKVI